MDFAWYLSKFSREARSVLVECTSEVDDIDDFFDDISKLTTLALENSSHKGMVQIDDDSMISIEFIFPDESGWKEFCSEFLALFKKEEK